MKRLARIQAGLFVFSLLQVNCETSAVPLSPLRLALSTYAQQQELVASDKAGNAVFGNAVAFSDDGKTALCGAKFDGVGGQPNAGAVYVFAQDGSGVFVQQQKLVASDRVGGFVFGNAVALSGDGNIALIASHSQSEPGHDANGAVYVFVRDAMGSFQQLQKFVASDLNDHGFFGYSLALSKSGNTAVVGAYGQDTARNLGTGAAYVWVRDTHGLFHQHQKLSAADATPADHFGHAVAIAGDGTTAIISAVGADESGLYDVGAAYVFYKDTAAVWTQAQKFLPSDKYGGEGFGYALALAYDGNTALIGTPGDPVGGAAYLFGQDGKGSWAQKQKLVADGMTAGDSFGTAVSLTGDGSLALIGAETFHAGGVNNQGAAYLFSEDSGGVFFQNQELTANDKDFWARFGGAGALSCDGKLALVGAIWSSAGGGTNQPGAAYVFSGSGTSSAAAACKGEVCAEGDCGDLPDNSFPEAPLPAPVGKPSPAEISSLPPPVSPIAQGCAMTGPKALGAFDALLLSLIGLLALVRRRVAWRPSGGSQTGGLGVAFTQIKQQRK